MGRPYPLRHSEERGDEESRSLRFLTPLGFEMTCKEQEVEKRSKPLRHLRCQLPSKGRQVLCHSRCSCHPSHAGRTPRSVTVRAANALTHRKTPPTAHRADVREMRFATSKGGRGVALGLVAIGFFADGQFVESHALMAQNDVMTFGYFVALLLLRLRLVTHLDYK